MTDTQHSTPEAGRVAKLLADGDLKAGRNELSERDIADLHAVLAQHADGARRLADSRVEWAVRADTGSIEACDDEAEASEIVEGRSWYADIRVVHRTVSRWIDADGHPIKEASA